jgi:hypothetical protein
MSDPHPAYKRLRDEAPVYWDPVNQIWGISRYRDVLSIERDTTRYSSARGQPSTHRDERLDDQQRRPAASAAAQAGVRAVLPSCGTQAHRGRAHPRRRADRRGSTISTHARRRLSERPTSRCSLMVIFRCLPGSDGTETEQAAWARVSLLPTKATAWCSSSADRTGRSAGLGCDQAAVVRHMASSSWRPLEVMGS